MNPEEEIILILSKQRVTVDARKRVQELTVDGKVDYDRLLSLASENGVSPLIFRNLARDEGMPEVVTDRLKSAYYQTLKRNMVQLNETLRIVKLLSAAGIGVVPVKGPLAAEIFFGDAGKYPSSDIDILIKPEDLVSARQVLEKDGYMADKNMTWEDLKKSTYHVVMSKGDHHVEIHWNLVMRYFSVGPEFWWEKMSLVVHDGSEMLVLSPERYLLYLIFRAFAKGFFPLKYLVLTAGLIEASRKDINWDEFFEWTEKLGMGKVAAFTLLFLQRELGTDCPGPDTGWHDTGYQFFRRLVLSGLFAPGRRVHLRMLLYTLLLQSPGKSAAILIRRIFPGLAEIRLRYGLASGSKTVYLYYLLNPILLATRKVNR